MPVVLLERVPVPSLATYTALSAMLLACVLFNCHRIVTDQILTDRNNRYDTMKETSLSTEEESDRPLQISQESDGYLMDLCAAMLQETWCIWVLVNTAYCCLLLFGKLIQQLIFGELRVVEQQQLKDKFWNFVFYKFIFVFGVMNVQTMEEVALWSAWFSLLGFLHLLAQLCKDRFQYLCSSPATPMWTHAKVLILLLCIELACICMLGVCFLVGLLFSGINTFAFMAAECILLVIKGLYVIVRYCIHLWDSTHEGIWENRSLYVYYSELIFELSALSVDFMHHLHMLLWGNIFLSMASLVIFMQLRFLFYEFQRRYRRHKNYLHVVSSMESKFPMAPKEKLEEGNENCAICWERLDSARTLPCGHLFHNSCLRSWLEQDTTCPTCRQSLADPTERDHVDANPGPAGDMPGQIPQAQQNPQQLYNHFFHFDGSRYVSWLPSFSVEVTHTTLLGERNTRPVIQNSQMDNMARQVREVFPEVPLVAIQEDLQRTRSVQLTLENIIEGNVSISQTMQRNSSLVASTETNSFSTALNTDIQSNYNGSQSYGDVTREHQLSPIVPEEFDNVAHDTQSSSSSSEINLYNENIEQYKFEPEQITDDEMYMQQHTRNDTSETTDNSAFNSIFDDNLPVPSFFATNSDDMTEESRDDTTYFSGYRFSKSSTERESMLQQRKQSLLDQAKRQYLSSYDQVQVNTSSANMDSDSQPAEEHSEHMQSTSYNVEDRDLQRRRDLAYEAAQRRIQRN